MLDNSGPAMVGAPADLSFSLTDDTGNNIRLEDCRGQYLLVFFGFTHCKVVCPRTLGKLSEVLGQLGIPGQNLRPFYITIDPERDTPERMHSFLHQAYPRFTGLTGGRAEIDRVKDAFRVFARRRDDPAAPGGYDLPHTALVYLVGPDGNLAAHFGATATVEELAVGITAVMTGQTGGSAPHPRP